MAGDTLGKLPARMPGKDLAAQPKPEPTRTATFAWQHLLLRPNGSMSIETTKASPASRPGPPGLQRRPATPSGRAQATAQMKSLSRRKAGAVWGGIRLRVGGPGPPPAATRRACIKPLPDGARRRLGPRRTVRLGCQRRGLHCGPEAAGRGRGRTSRSGARDVGGSGGVFECGDFEPPSSRSL